MTLQVILFLEKINNTIFILLKDELSYEIKSEISQDPPMK